MENVKPEPQIVLVTPLLVCNKLFQTFFFLNIRQGVKDQQVKPEIWNKNMLLGSQELSPLWNIQIFIYLTTVVYVS